RRTLHIQKPSAGPFPGDHAVHGRANCRSITHGHELKLLLPSQRACWFGSNKDPASDGQMRSNRVHFSRSDSGIQTPATISGLTPGTTYLIQARAVTKAGYTDYGQPIAQMVI